jgi:hypothetical protein
MSEHEPRTLGEALDWYEREIEEEEEREARFRAEYKSGDSRYKPDDHGVAERGLRNLGTLTLAILIAAGAVSLAIFRLTYTSKNVWGRLDQVRIVVEKP